jgi:hypothetical protein
MSRFEELKTKAAGDLILGSPKLKTKTKSKKITANHTHHPILQGNEYSLICEGRDFYNVKCRGQSVYVDKWIFDSPAKVIPKWILEQMEDYDETYD